MEELLLAGNDTGGRLKQKIKCAAESAAEMEDKMSKIAVVYWSGTGNTEVMASAVSEGAKEKGAEVSLLTSSEFSADQVGDYDAIAFGCPSMGEEQLEESESIRTEIEHTISCLPDMLQQTILLERYIDGKAWWQIADHLQITDRWAKELHRRAVQNLEIVHSSSC